MPREENESSPQILSQRRASLIEKFQEYIHITFHELHLASHAETEALRSPLLSMHCTEEDIQAWENFRAFLPKLLDSAQALHAEISRLLEQATSNHLLDANDIVRWHAFFRSTDIGFQEKKQEAAELARKLSAQSMQNTDEHPLKEKKEQSIERNIPDKNQDTEIKIQKMREQEGQEENTKQENLRQEEDVTHEPPHLLQSTQLHTRWLLTLLPSSLAPLYTTAASRGSETLKAVHATIEQSLLRQHMGLRHDKGTIILTHEQLQNTESPLDLCKTCAVQGEKAPTIILKSLSLPTQSAVVHGIHQNLLQDVRTLEQHGMCF